MTIKKITDAQNFNFVRKLSHNKGCQPHILHFWTKYITKFFRLFLTGKKLWDAAPIKMTMTTVNRCNSLIM